MTTDTDETPVTTKFAPTADAKDEAAREALTALMRIKGSKVTKRQASELKERFVNLMADVDDETFRLLMADDEISSLIRELNMATGKAKPGDPIYDDKGREMDRVPYDSQWMMENMPMVEFTPMTTETVSWNGVAWRVYEGMVNTVPSAIRDIYMESYQKTRQAEAEQRAVLEHYAPIGGDMGGVTLQQGWRKMTNEELEAQPGNRTV